MVYPRNCRECFGRGWAASARTFAKSNDRSRSARPELWDRIFFVIGKSISFLKSYAWPVCSLGVSVLGVHRYGLPPENSAGSWRFEADLVRYFAERIFYGLDPGIAFVEFG
jgi:hypothetical protein